MNSPSKCMAATCARWNPRPMKSSTSCGAYRELRTSGLFRVLGQPNLNLVVDRQEAARYGLNVADVQDAVETAIGGKAVTQVLQGEQVFDLVVRYQAPYRDTKEAIENIRIVAPKRRACRPFASHPRGNRRRCLGNLPRSELPLRCHQVQRSWPRSRQHRGRSHGQGTTNR